jgi:hypothetical protein
MKKTPAAPAPDVTPEQALERMKALVRQIVAAPKRGAPKPKKQRKRH